MVNFHDNIVSRLESPISDTDKSLTVSHNFSTYDIPSEGWLTIGTSEDLRPLSDGTPPSAEVVKYEDVSYGTSITVFGDPTYYPLSRGVDNTTAQSWNSGVMVGLGITGDLLDLTANYDFVLSFTDADLNSGILTITHNLGVPYPNVDVFDDSSPKKRVIPDEIIYSDSNTVKVDLSSFNISTYDWTVRVS